jgi:nitrate/nitrite transporter NarK
MARRWQAFRFGLVLTLAMGVGPLIIFTLSAMSPVLIADLGLSRIQFGSLAMVAYLSAAPICLVAGQVLRVIPPRYVLLLSFILTAIGLVSLGLADAWVWLVLAAVLSGIVQSLSNPVTNLLVSTAPSNQARGAVMGVKQAGVQMGQLTAGLLPLAALVVHWRVAVVALVVIALAGCAFTIASVPRRGQHDVVLAGAGNRLPAEAWWLFAYSLFVGAAVQGTNVYLPLFGVETLDLAPAVAGATMIIVGLLGMMGRIGWGRASDTIRRPHLALATLALISVTGSALLLTASVTGVAWPMWTGVVLHGGGAVAANVVIIHALIKAVAPGKIATASGYQALAQYLGFAIGPVTYGALVETTGSYLYGWLMVAMAYLLALIIAMTFLRRRSQVPAGASPDA